MCRICRYLWSVRIRGLPSWGMADLGEAPLGCGRPHTQAKYPCRDLLP